MSDSAHPARRRHEYMPNRMFDPVANPFAVQNLLIKEQQPFELVADERPEFGFESDPLISKEGPGAFLLDEVIELADLNSGTAFEADTDIAAGNPFVTEAAAAAGVDADAVAAGDDFVADAAIHAHGADQVIEGDAEAADAEAIEASAQSHISADADNAADTLSEDVASLGEAVAAASDELAESPSEAMPVAEAVAEPVTAEAGPAEAELSPEPVPEPAPVAEAAAPDLSGEAVTALVEAAREQARAEAREQAYNEGLEAGKAAAKAELQQAHDAQITRLKTLQEALKKLSFDADALFEPVKKLTIHLAEQLVRGELTQSPQAISRLVDNSLRELNASGEKAVIVHLNPDDLEAYRPLVAQFGDSMILRPDALLERGSVRVALDGSVVEDLMQRRVDGLKKSLSQPAAPGWQTGGTRLADRLNDSQRSRQQVEDVTAVETAGGSDVSDD